MYERAREKRTSGWPTLGRGGRVEGIQKNTISCGSELVCIYISQADLFSGLFTHNVLGAAKMPVVFYLDIVAMCISHRIRKSLQMRDEPPTSGKARKPL